MNSNSRKLLKGLAGVTLISLLLLAVFFGKLITSLNCTFFSVSGDGIQSYFNSVYLVKYDSSLFFSHSMNYPYGELSFYTQAQPILMAPFKIAGAIGIDSAKYIPFIINFLMLASVVAGAIFLFLIFYESGLKISWAILAGTGIAFLSPQIDRMGGHFTLSYVWAIPALIYMLILFHKHKKTKYSIWISVILFILITGHIYFAGFFLGILFTYWIFQLILKGEKKVGFLHALFQFSIQFIFPLLLFYFIISFYDQLIPERPSRPYGFLIYKATPESVFLPLSVDYGRMLHKIKDFSNVQWEGIAYVGLTGLTGFLAIIGLSVSRLFRRNWSGAFLITGNSLMDSLFWSSLLMLAYSFGIPFVLGLESLVDYLGPIQQMRALGRFAWPFFYVINIVVFFLLWQWYQRNKNVRFIVLTALIMTFADVFYYLKDKQNLLNNSFPEWSHISNFLEDNRLIRSLDASSYQALIPVPFYHMGSDNFNMSIRCNMMSKAYLISAKTGIPVLPIYLSRASVPQSVKNITTVLEPYRELELLKDLPDKRPFLLLSTDCNEILEEETGLISISKKIDSNTLITLYKLEYDSLENLFRKKAAITIDEWEELGKPDSLATCESILLDYNHSKSKGYRGNSLVITGREVTHIYNGPLPDSDRHDFRLCFWLYPINRDLVPKTRLILEGLDSTGKVNNYMNVMCGDFLKTTDAAWGLIEFTFSPNAPEKSFRISLHNELINKNTTYLVDEFMLIPDSCLIYLRKETEIMKNNRWYNLLKPQ